MVSGTISLPSRGTFHHSLTVLIRYRSSGSIQPYQVVLADSHKITRVPCYSGTTTHAYQPFRLQDSHPLRSRFPTHSTTTSNIRAHPMPRMNEWPHNTAHATLARLHTHGLGSSAFARHYSRNHYYFLFLWVLRCFTSPRSPHTPYIFRCGSRHMTCRGVSPFGHPRITVRLPTPRGLSQVTASFIGS
jgi:hypothetical protein